MPKRFTVTLTTLIALGCSSASTSPAGTGTDASGGDSAADASPVVDGARVPANHRAVAEPCPTDTPKGDCSSCIGPCTDGKNGRCMQGAHTCACRYDACVVAADCGPGKSCSCRTRVLDARGTNLCIDGNCDVDADCDPSGYCSPTFDTTCGRLDGVIGWYCHTPKDTCIDDADCNAGGKIGYCAYVKAKAHWECAYAVCTG
jgi:hypothetical protein